MLDYTYANFWVRLSAFLIDGVIVLCFIHFVLRPLILAMCGIDIGPTFHFDSLQKIHEFRRTHPGVPYPFDATKPDLLSRVVKFMSWIIFNWLYSAIPESSSKQGTIGKILLRIKVADIDGNRISFWRATLRFFSKYVSGLILGIGFLIAAFTKKKQALHDLIAKTIVIKK